MTFQTQRWQELMYVCAVYIFVFAPIPLGFTSNWVADYPVLEFGLTGLMTMNVGVNLNMAFYNADGYACATF